MLDFVVKRKIPRQKKPRNSPDRVSIFESPDNLSEYSKGSKHLKRTADVEIPRGDKIRRIEIKEEDEEEFEDYEKPPLKYNYEQIEQSYAESIRSRFAPSEVPSQQPYPNRPTQNHTPKKKQDFAKSNSKYRNEPRASAYLSSPEEVEEVEEEKNYMKVYIKPKNSEGYQIVYEGDELPEEIIHTYSPKKPFHSKTTTKKATGIVFDDNRASKTPVRYRASHVKSPSPSIKSDIESAKKTHIYKQEQSMQALREERDALKHLLNKMIILEKNNSKASMPSESNYMKPIGKVKKASSRPRSRTPTLHSKETMSPSRKSPFDIDRHSKKTEWETKEPYVNKFNKVMRGVPDPQHNPHTQQLPRPQPQKYKNRAFEDKAKGRTVELPDCQFCAFCEDYVHPQCYEYANGNHQQ